jgi:copper chaperone CopZ
MSLESYKYFIQGMTCESCVKTITEKLGALPQVVSAQVSLEKKSVEIVAQRKIDLAEIKKSLADLPKYSVSDHPAKLTDEKSWFQTYKPLLIVFVFIFLFSSAYQISLYTFNSHLFMNHIMAGFFIGLSFFKFLDLKSFSESFSSYDPIAQRWLNYGYVYPFIELALGFLFISGQALLFANSLTVLVLSATTIGVYKRLQAKSPFQCACLGTTFSLPLSNLTITENVIMILMAIYGVLP